MSSHTLCVIRYTHKFNFPTFKKPTKLLAPLTRYSTCQVIEQQPRAATHVARVHEDEDIEDSERVYSPATKTVTAASGSNINQIPFRGDRDTDDHSNDHSVKAKRHCNPRHYIPASLGAWRVSRSSRKIQNRNSAHCPRVTARVTHTREIL